MTTAPLLVSALYIYPVKSLGGIRLREMKLTEKGPELDRNWMLVDTDNRFLTQRTHPELALFQPRLSENHLSVYHKQSEENRIGIPLHGDHNNAPENVEVWGDHVKALEVAPRVSEWFSDMLKLNCKLVSMPENTVRISSASSRISFADGHPYLITGEESLKSLNDKLNDPVPMNRFRPNIVFKGGEAFEEDNWTNIRIGNKDFRIIKPCARCSIPTINQHNGKRDEEPLRTLSSFRKRGNKVLFGVNANGEHHGTIKQGQAIAVF